VALGARTCLHEPQVPIEAVYFPLDCVISLLATVDEGVLVEVATVGNEGLIGLPLFLETKLTPGWAYCQVPGDACRLPAASFRQLLRRTPAASAILHRYTQALMTQISQGTACDRVHSNEQRSARWLLQTHDRAGRDEFPLPEEFLGQMLGADRGTVEAVTSQLAERGLIGYRDGMMRMLDREGLEAISCGCYRVIRAGYERAHAELQGSSVD
jgi:hypothetical protein